MAWRRPLWRLLTGEGIVRSLKPGPEGESSAQIRRTMSAR